MSQTMQGRVCVVTGGNGGIGRATAEALAGMGATVVLLCRSRERGEQTVSEIGVATGNAPQLVVADLASMAEVRRAAGELLAKHSQIHVLISNAAVFLPQREVTADGFEKTFATNYLSHFLLTNLLLERLQASSPARIVNVATLTRGLSIDLDDLMLEKRKYSIFAAVGPTKLALILMTLELSRRLAGTGVTVNALHPGLVKSGLLDDSPWIMRKLFHLMSGSPEKGARTPVYLASSPDVASVSGKLFVDCKETTMGAVANADTARRLWDISAKLLGIQSAAA